MLHDVSVTIRRGELVGIVGGSGAGKTTLLHALAGVQRPDSGHVLFDGLELYPNLGAFRGVLGYVPQDDIIHAELPLERTLRYAATLRLPEPVSRSDIDAAVARVLVALELEDCARLRVGDLSGGQRKRASIGAELLTEPHAFFLDEPTSGLDPATDAELLRVLRGLADDGSTVVFTTHQVHDLAHCDRIVVLARDGYLAFVGTAEEACRYFQARRTEEIYVRLDCAATPTAWAERFARHRHENGHRTGAPPAKQDPALCARPPAGFLRQWRALSMRTFETLVRSPLTLGILIGSPVMVVAMFAILFSPGTFDFDHPSPSAIAMIVFWITFAAFFFGITYGLLQICTEGAIVRREHLVGQRASAYLLSKLTVLLPFLLIVNALMLGLLRALDRLPGAGTMTYLSLGITLVLESGAALTLGLLTSAALANPAQATLALPMVCFPAVLFSGGIVPVHVMASVGAAISTVVPVRWAFEALGHSLRVRYLLLHGGSPLGPPLVHAYGNAGEDATGVYWLYLGTFTAVFLAAAWATLVRKCTRET
ncbi:MAG: ATP-binding cassette domain-containing protein [Solirubrobacterales bacterium]|nr:ATP-binding cassette domain-containing protein [Solirubrobacterales bacterium]